MVLLSCVMLTFTSCSQSFVYKKAPTHNGFGPPAHAPAHGYRRKYGQAVVVHSEPVVAGSLGKTSKNGDDDKDKTKLAVAGAALAASAVYGVINERDKNQTQAQLSEMRQEMKVLTVNITNSNGSISQVRLQKQGVGYVGPKGEYYDHLPIDTELRPAYGL